jgi:hypothetical protein
MAILVQEIIIRGSFMLRQSSIPYRSRILHFEGMVHPSTKSIYAVSEEMDI